MQNFKKLVASVMATTMIASCAGMTTFASLSASAADETYTVNIAHPQDNKLAEHTHSYGAYQIFAGDVDANDPGKLFNITWGSSIGDTNGVKLAKHLVKLYRDRENDADERYILFKEFSDNQTLSDLYELDGKSGLTDAQKEKLANAKKNSAFAVAEVLQDKNDFHNNSLEMYKFAKEVKNFIIGNPIDESDATYTPGGPAATNGMVTLTLTQPGYYMFNDTSDPDDVSSTTAYLLGVVSDSETPLQITAKVDKPTLDKNIVEGNTETKVNTASIGDTIHYRLKSKVPSMVGYNKYFFNISDTLDETLDFQEDSVSVYLIKGTDQTTKVPLVKSTPTDDITTKSYYVTADSYLDEDDNPQKQNIKLVFENFIQYQGTWNEGNNRYDDSMVDYNIIVEYDAVLMENARIGDKIKENEANINEAQLIYSNDPNVIYKGKPTKPDEPNDPNDPDGDPDSEEPTGKTPQALVATFTTELDLIKVDNNGKRLSGAKFRVEGEGMNVVVTYKETFDVDTNGTYYKLKDGTFTETAPTAATQSNYDSTTTKYTLNEETISVDTDNGTTSFEAVVGDDGILKLKGLGKGVYTVTETEAPSGYSKAKDPFTVNIDAEVTEVKDPTNYSVEWKLGATPVSSNGVTVDTNGVFAVTIVNTPGSTLPGTGGIGTALFYIVGSLMMAGSVVLFVVKKKSEAKEG